MQHRNIWLSADVQRSGVQFVGPPASEEISSIAIKREARLSAPFSTAEYRSTPFNTVQHRSAPFETIQQRSEPFSTVQHHSAPFNIFQYRSALFKTIQHRSALQQRLPLLSEHRLSAFHETSRKATTGLLSDEDADDDDDDDYSVSRPIVFSSFV
jgi:hypothetical protein